MKKPRRRKPRLDPETVIWSKLYGKKKTGRHISERFCRINNRRRYLIWKDFAEAGYPMAVLRKGVWSEVHKWCIAQFGDQYTWTGEKFWFQTKEDRDKFKERWG